MYMSMYTYVYTCIPMYIQVCMYGYKDMCTCHIYMYMCILCAYIYVSVEVTAYISLYICVYIYLICMGKAGPYVKTQAPPWGGPPALGMAWFSKYT